MFASKTIVVAFAALAIAAPTVLGVEAEAYRGDGGYSKDCIMYEVRHGDYCYKIANSNGIPYSDFLQQNPGINCESLQTQVFCEVARSRFKARFPEVSDDDIENIDFDALHRGYRDSPIPETELDRDVGTTQALEISVAEVDANLAAVAGIGIGEQELQGLGQADIDAAASGSPRMLPCELIAPWACCDANEIPRERHDPILKPCPLNSSERIVLYLHGGSYVMGSPGSHRSVLGKFSGVCRLRLFVPDYRLAPRFPFPAQLHDALIAFKYLVSQGFPPENILLGGDSAGSHLCLGLTLLLRHMDRSVVPGALILLSPMTCLDTRGPSKFENAQYDYIWPVPLEQPTSPIRLFYKPGSKCTEEYRQEIRHPLLEPANGDLAGFPPTMIQMGDREILLDDARRLHQKLAQSNPQGKIVYEEYKDMVHVFHRFTHRPEATRARESVARFISSL
ncbi:hypothetical protein GGF46_001387 [Coemansia sp. RSA 552]|nr:hypothetical protein GGF46_001387 [Coemansia sp. RSA 552]